MSSKMTAGLLSYMTTFVNWSILAQVSFVIYHLTSLVIKLLPDNFDEYLAIL